MTSATYFYFKEQNTQIEPKELPKRKTTALSPFVEECMEMATREGIKRMGVTGGYIDYPLLIENDPASYLKLSPFKEGKMPYWWYAGENRVLPLTDPKSSFSIKAQLERYVTIEIEKCIDNFTFIPEYEVEKIGDTKVEITFGEKDISVLMKYPIKGVKLPMRNEFVMDEFDFFVQLPIRFKKVFQAANDIMVSENIKHFMERWTIDLISLADSGEKKSTPFMSMDFSLKPRIWQVKDIKAELSDLLVKNTQYIKFDKTSYLPFPENMPYMKNHYLWRFTDDEYPGIHASVTYDPKWPIRFDISPSRGGIVKSGSTGFSNLLSWVGLQIWHFNYDLVYPVTVTLYDENSNFNEDYTFTFSFLVSVQNNRPFKDTFETTVFDTVDNPSTTEVCEYLVDSFDQTLVINTYNEYSETPLNNVNLSFTCGKYRCPLGQSDLENNGAAASLKALMPYCSYGILKGEKKGYISKPMFISTGSMEYSVDMNLKPFTEITDFNIKKHTYYPNNQVGTRVGIAGEKLYTDEEVIIIISHPELGDQFITKNSNESLPLKLLKDKEFTYNITSYLFRDSDDEQGVLLGGYQGQWTPSVNEVSRGNHITFHMLEYMSSNELEMGLFLTGLNSYSDLVSSPELTRVVS